MNAGRELDALVAEKVMGIDLSKKCGGYVDEGGFKGWYCDGCGFEGEWGDERAWEHTVQPRLYSTRIEDAWMVVEKINGMGHVVEIINDLCAWSVKFTNIDTGKSFVADWKNSLPTQICLAALEAVNNE